jgi:capsular exopolysaccharide synthesis family protein
MRENQHFGGASEQPLRNSGNNERALVRARGRAAAAPARQDYLEVPPYVIGESPYEQASGGGLVEYWSLLRRRKGTLLLGICLGGLTGLLVTLPQTPVYQAKGVVEILPMNVSYEMRRSSPIAHSGGVGDLLDIQTQIRVLQSESLIDRVLHKLSISKPDQVANETSRVSAWRRLLNLPQAENEDSRRSALTMAAGNLKVRATPQTRVIEILCDSTDPKLAADFINTLTSEFIDNSLEARWQASQRTEEWLTRQLDEIRIRLEKSEEAMQGYARRAGLVMGANAGNFSEDKLKQVQTQLTQARADRITKQSRYEMAKDAPVESLPDVLNDNSLRDYQTKLTDLRRQQAELATRFEPTYPKIRALEAQINELSGAMLRERKAILNRIDNDYQEALRKESLLSTDYSAQSKQLGQESEKAVQYNILKREVDTYRQIYASMLERVKESGVTAALRATNVRIVDAAKPPRRPSQPQPIRTAAIGLFAGLVMGAGFVVLRERADRTLQDPGDAEFYMGLPELGIIPRADGGRIWSKLSQSKAAAAAVTAARETVGALIPSSSLPSCLELMTHQNQRSAVAESFRSVLTSIMFSGVNGKRPRVMVVTSAGPGEGKTTAATNLAAALAEVNQKVLLIDADLRRPRAHSVFQLDNSRGLTTILTANPPIENFGEFVRQTPVANLSVVTSGPPSSAAANLLYAKALETLIRAASLEYDMILIDTPPMLQIPDARIIGRLADAMILVIRSGKTSRDAGVAIRQRLTDDGTPVLGVIMNDWNPKSSSGGYYGYHSGYYSNLQKYYEAPAAGQAGRRSA